MNKATASAEKLQCWRGAESAAGDDSEVKDMRTHVGPFALRAAWTWTLDGRWLPPANNDKPQEFNLNFLFQWRTS